MSIRCFMKVKLLKNFTCNRLRLKSGQIIEGDLLATMEARYSIQTLEQKEILIIIEPDITEESKEDLPTEGDNLGGIVITEEKITEEKKSKKSKKR